MLFERPFTPWSIEIIEDQHNDGSLYSAVFRTTTRDDQQCEQFTLVGEQSESDIYIQIRIFKSNEVTFETWVPAVVRVSQKNKRITVSFLQPLEPA
ncbi:MAG: hypothetical protein M0Q15_02675 [Nevskia sp.]|nr:hypothetical protein [Nevskia sp.]